MPDYKIVIKTRDNEEYIVRHAGYECDGILLIINQGEDQFLFPMDFVVCIIATLEDEEDAAD